jgi:hypothetical protein
MKLDQAKLALHRAISQRRLAEYGLLPDDVALWWAQISAVAQRMGVATAWIDWQAESRDGSPPLPEPDPIMLPPRKARPGQALP